MVIVDRQVMAQKKNKKKACDVDRLLIINHLHLNHMRSILCTAYAICLCNSDTLKGGERGCLVFALWYGSKRASVGPLPV